VSRGVGRASLGGERSTVPGRRVSLPQLTRNLHAKSVGTEEFFGPNTGQDQGKKKKTCGGKGGISRGGEGGTP